MKICMLAAENDALPGAKVGGIGDVIRDLPGALASLGIEVSVILPSYDALHQLEGMQQVSTFSVPFRGKHELVSLYRLAAGAAVDELSTASVAQYVVHHPWFGVCGAGAVYCDDADGQPFATDASKFALYCAAALQAIQEGLLDEVDVLHLHDWHAGLAAVLKSFHPHFASLRSLRSVFSIHNLALQGIRPLTEQASSLQAWFPEMDYDSAALSDPRWPHCVNPMAAGIRLADEVSTVSPNYAQEIMQANDMARGFHGGEGLELDLQKRADEGNLHGIVNGIDYPSSKLDRQDWASFCSDFNQAYLQVIANDVHLRGIDYLAHQRLLDVQQQTMPQHLLTSIGRLTTQKATLFFTHCQNGKTALDNILQQLEGRGLFIMIGSGDPLLEKACQRLSGEYRNFIFINRYAETLAQYLYAQGDLFLMPSSFEPCGISQMLAMCAGQPCVVHAVGGLADTIVDQHDGFSFSAVSTTAQADAFVQRVMDVIELRENDPKHFQEIADKASEKRFEWDGSARRYVSELYQ